MYKKVRICNIDEFLAIMTDDDRCFNVRIREKSKNFMVDDNGGIVAIYDKNLNDLKPTKK